MLFLMLGVVSPGETGGGSSTNMGWVHPDHAILRRNYGLFLMAGVVSPGLTGGVATHSHGVGSAFSYQNKEDLCAFFDAWCGLSRRDRGRVIYPHGVGSP